MTRRLGDRATFAVEFGEVEPHQLRVVDLWATGTATSAGTIVLPSAAMPPDNGVVGR
ncbi:hypothetical protein [Micromonospora taraxaci]